MRVQSLDHLESLYTRAGFNDKAKFGFLRVAVTQLEPVASISMYCGACDYAQLVKAVQDFDSGKCAFQLRPTPEKASKTTPGTDTDKEIKLFVRPDARVQKMEAKIDTLADQLSSLTLILLKGHSQVPRNRFPAQVDGTEGAERMCSFCNKPGHGANRCLTNPNHDRRCNNCGKLDHGPETC